MAASRRESVTLGEWLDRAIRQQIKADRNQAVGPSIEETLATLAASMAQQADATRQQNAAIAARLEAVEQHERESGHHGGGNFFGRLHGLLRRPVTKLDSANGRTAKN
jgi:Arc/MetJ-type ribon-helix-helix transcriptional regulator